jgi:hypothetical protein
VIGEEDDFALVLIIPDHDSAKEMRAFFLGVVPREPDKLIGEDIKVARRDPLLDDFKVRIFLEPCDKEDTIVGPGAK